jgi:hypothetical protein
MLDSKIKVLLSTIPIALLGTLMVLVVQTVTLPAMAQPAQETFFEAAVKEGGQTGQPNQTAAAAAPSPQPSSAEQPNQTAAGAAMLRQGQISSSLSDVPGREDTQSAVIIPPRDDNAVLSGILTYQASRPVELFVWNNVEPENTTAIPEEFGDLGDIVKIGGKTFALADVSSGASGSVPFAGNAVEVVGEDEPFIVTYSLNAIPALANLVNNLQSINSFNATAPEGGADAGDDDDEG